jgi:uncharacterized protein YicC (UPF0701 family)
LAVDGPVEPEGGEHYDRGIEPRLSRVEHDVRDLKDTLADLKTIVVRMDAKLDAVLPHLATKADVANLENKLVAMGADMDLRFGAVDAKFDAVDAKFEAMDAKFEAMDAKMDAKFDAMDAKMDAKFDAMDAKMDAKLGVMDARLEATLPHLATKADLADKPSKTYMWGILAALLTACACGLAALAVLK